MGEQQSSTNNDNGGEPSSKDRLSTRLKVAGCVAFLVLSVALWMMSGRSWFLWLLLLIPCFLAEEYLAEKVNTQSSRWSTAESGFSVLRIVYGLILALLIFGAIYGLILIARWFF
jgi:hypothetical protein